MSAEGPIHGRVGHLGSVREKPFLSRAVCRLREIIYDLYSTSSRLIVFIPAYGSGLASISHTEHAPYRARLVQHGTGSGHLHRERTYSQQYVQNLKRPCFRPLLYCHPRLRDSSYHQFRNIQPSKSVIWVADPAFMMKLVTPVGVQSRNQTC